jgi:hypothetical protein
VLQARQTCVDAARLHLLGNREQLARLQRQSGLEADNDGDAHAALLTALEEHDGKLSMAAELRGEDLNSAFVHSVLA